MSTQPFKHVAAAAPREPCVAPAVDSGQPAGTVGPLGGARLGKQRKYVGAEQRNGRIVLRACIHPHVKIEERKKQQ